MFSAKKGVTSLFKSSIVKEFMNKMSDAAYSARNMSGIMPFQSPMNSTPKSYSRIVCSFSIFSSKQFNTNF